MAILRVKDPTTGQWQEIPALQGNDGKSAYEIAVENGFVGTEAEWLESLKGEDGTPADLSEYAKKSELPTKVSELTNDSGFLDTSYFLVNYTQSGENYSADKTFAEIKQAFVDGKIPIANYTNDKVYLNFINYEETNSYGGMIQFAMSFRSSSKLYSYLINHFGDEYISIAANKTTLVGAEGGTFTGDVLVSSDPTQDMQVANKQYVDTKVAGIVNSAPETLDTLNELATALGNDPNFATTMATELGKKANSADLAAVAKSGSYNDLFNKPTIPTIPTSLPANGGNSTTVNGHTVNADVPADAKFTDTTYGVVSSTADGLVPKESWIVKNITSNSSGGVVQITNGSNVFEIDFGLNRVSINEKTLLNTLNYSSIIGLASSSKYGLMSAYDKAKLDGLGGSATYVISKDIVFEGITVSSFVPSDLDFTLTDDEKAILSSYRNDTSVDKVLMLKLSISDELDKWAGYNFPLIYTTGQSYVDNGSFVGEVNGIKVAVNVLNGAVSFSEVPTATATANGLMSSSDKSKLDKVIAKSYQLVSKSITSIDLVVDTVFQFAFQVTNLTVNTPDYPSDGNAHEIILKFTTGDSPTISWSSSLLWANGEVMTIEANSLYEFSIGFDYNASKWTIIGTKFS